jgi:hypothetical protein
MTSLTTWLKPGANEMNAISGGIFAHYGSGSFFFSFCPVRAFLRLIIPNEDSLL